MKPVQDADRAKRQGRETEEENNAIIEAWRNYVQRPDDGVDDLLLAIDRMIQRAIARWGKNRLPAYLWSEAGQELRLRLFVRRQYLLHPPLVRELNKNSPLSASGAKLINLLERHIYQQAFYAVIDVIRREARYAAKRDALQAHAMEASSEGDVSPRHDLAVVRRGLRRLGYDAAESRLFIRYFRGRVTQRELGENLGLQQPGVSKRIQRIRGELAASRMKSGTADFKNVDF
ncbi:MAG: hypothetical protein M3Z64_09670 [Verrucomicrobiota bacterium]|nr:hypothetical protein [Verrucomicrobiota bacterium]